MLGQMNPLAFLATRCTVGGKETGYFDKAAQEDTHDPNPFLAELLATNESCMRARAAELTGEDPPLHAIVLPEPAHSKPMSSDDMEIAGLLEFLRNNETNAWFEFTTYED